MRKIILFGLMMLMVMVVGGGIIEVLACVPREPPTECGISQLCGSQECVGTWVTVESVKVPACELALEACKVLEAEGLCNPQVEVINPFNEVVQGIFDGIVSSIADIIKTGAFPVGTVPETEIPICMDQVKTANLKPEGFDRWTAKGIKQSTFENHLKDPGINHAEVERVAPQLARNPEFLSAVKDAGYQWVNPDQLAKFIEECDFFCGTNTLESVVDQQKWSILANPKVDAARAAYGIKLSSINEIGVTSLKLYNNLYQKFQPIIELYNSPLVRLASMAHGAYSIISSAFGGSGGGKDQSAAKTAAAATASQGIQNVQNSNPVGTTKIITCPKGTRLSYNAAKCPGQPNCVYDTKDQASQCLSALPPGGNVEVRFGSIHIIDHKLNNMFSLTGSQNEGVVYQDDGFVNLDDGGTTKISVAGDGAAVTDHKDHELYIGKGTTYYFGNGNENADFFLTDSYLVSDEAKIAIDSINRIEQNKYQSKGNFKEKIELAITLDGYSLKPYKNAVDVAKIDETFQVLTRGFSDILLLEEEKVFPFVTRNYAKGDASIVMHRNVKIPNTYIVNDETYEYTIKTIGDSTKVIAKNGKIIEDSGPLNTRLSRRQNILVNNI